MIMSNQQECYQMDIRDCWCLRCACSAYSEWDVRNSADSLSHDNSQLNDYSLSRRMTVAQNKLPVLDP